MGGDGREPFPWLLICLLIIGFTIGLLGGLALASAVLL